MKKIIISLLTLLILTSCQLNSDKELTKIIEAQINENPQKIDLSKIKAFNYDELIILEPYSNIEKIQTELNLDLSNITKNEIYHSDFINLLVFIKNNKSIKISELDRHIGDFTDYKVLIKRENANFYKNDQQKIILIK